MSRSTNRLYEFGPFRLDAAKGLLFRGEEPIPLTPKAFDTLLALVESAGRLVGKEELMSRVWPETVVEEGGLARNISVLRKALGESPDDHHYIVTVPGRGYRFVAEARELAEQAPVPPIAPGPPPEAQDAGPPSPTALPPPIAAAGDVLRAARRPPWGLFALLAVVIVLAAALSRLIVPAPTAAPPFRKMSMARLTHTGRSRDAAISPDGTRVVHVADEGGRQSLWLKHVATSRDVQIVPPAGVQYWGLTFSRDGNSIYYVAWERNASEAELYRVPALGGTPRKLLADVDGPITFSPDEKRFAFVVNSSTRGESRLMLSSADGQLFPLAIRKQPDFFLMYPGGPAWSPDGAIIATAAGSVDGGGRYKNVLEVRISDGQETPISFQRWSELERVAWLPGGRGVLVAARDQPTSPLQIWQIAYPRGEASRITNDLNDYSGVSLSKDASLLATVQADRLSSLWVVSPGDPTSARRVPPEGGRHDGLEGISWTPDGRIVYASRESGSPDIWITGSDGTGRRQLTADARSNIHPSVTPDGRRIVFGSDRAGAFNVWRMDVDGGNPKQLTDGGGELFPQCSPDGRWVIFQKGYGTGARMTLWKAPIEGGEAVQVTDTLSLQPALSPDGKRIAHYSLEKDGWGVAIIPFEGGEPIRRISLPTSGETRVVRWSPDGRSLTYIDERDGAYNIWSQPLDGRPPRRLTDFTVDRIFNFDWSRDGKRLACARGIVAGDVVLIRDFR